MDLNHSIAAAVERYWADEVQILGSWPDGPTVAYVVYRRTIDPTVTLGQRFEFHANAADGTVEGYAQDIAINLAEPIGAAVRPSQPDRYGVIWLTFRDEQSTPQPPASVADLLSARR